MTNTKEIRVNLNDFIKVKLSKSGEEIYSHRYDEINEFMGRVIVPKPPKKDGDGYTRFQLWDFMNLYGEHLHMGFSNQVLETMDILLETGECEENIDADAVVKEWKNAMESGGMILTTRVDDISIDNVIVIPYGATRKEVHREIFGIDPPELDSPYYQCSVRCAECEHKDDMNCDVNWWNAPYKAESGGKE